MTFSGLDLLGADDIDLGFTPGAVRAAALPAEDAADLRAGRDLALRLQSGAAASPSPPAPSSDVSPSVTDQRAMQDQVARNIAMLPVSEGWKKDLTDPGWRQKEALAAKKAEKGKVIGAMNTIVVSGLVGAVGGGIGGALLWRTQRFLGALLGSLLLGGPAGATVGTLLVANKAKESL